MIWGFMGRRLCLRWSCRARVEGDAPRLTSSMAAMGAARDKRRARVFMVVVDAESPDQKIKAL